MVLAMRSLLMICLISVPLLAHASGPEAEVKLLIDRAETQVWLGISNKGCSDEATKACAGVAGDIAAPPPAWQIAILAWCYSLCGSEN